MNDLEKAKLVLADRNITLKTISEKTGVPFQTVKGYSANLYKLKAIAWYRVYAIAQLYDCKSSSKILH